MRPLRRTRPWVALALGAGAFLLYVQLAGHEFLHYDDNVYVTENPFVLRGVTWTGIVWAFTRPDAWYGFPLDWLSHMLDVQLFGLNPGAHLLVNAFWHAANVLLVYALLARLTGFLGRSAAVAALFAVHPLHVEVVAWVSERKELLSTFFGLLAIHAYASYAARPSARRYGVVVVVFGASLLAKPMWVTLPFVLLLVDLWPLRRGDGIRHLVLEKVPLVGLALAAAVVAGLAQQHGGALRGSELTLGARLGYAGVSYVLYLAKTFWPFSLAAFYPHPGSGLPGWQIIGAWLFLAAATCAVIGQVRRRPWLTVGWLWFTGMLVPVIGIVVAGQHGIADRYTYAPLLGLFIAVVWGACEIAERLRLQRMVAPLAVAVVCALAALTWRQQAYWSDQVTLFTHAVEVTEGNALAHHVLSQGLLAQGRVPQALVHAREAVRLQPGVARFHKNLGYALYRAGLLDDAIGELRTAIVIEPDYAEAHGNLAIAYGRKGWMDAARQELALEQRLRSRPAAP